MADEIKGAAQSSCAPTYVQQEANATPKVTDPTNVHEALTASTEPNATSIGNLDAKNRRMYKHIPAEMRRDYLEDEAEQARVDANQDAVIEDHVGRLAVGAVGEIGKSEVLHVPSSSYGHIAGVAGFRCNFGTNKNIIVTPVAISPADVVVDGNVTRKKGDLFCFPTHDDMPGVARAGNGLYAGDESDPVDVAMLHLKPATASTIGGVKVGDNISVTEDGTISTDVNKAYVDSKLNTVNSIAPTNVEYAPSIGNDAIAFGSGVRASLQSVGVGYRASSMGASSVAIGFQPIASGLASVAIGFGAEAYGEDSVAIGSNSKAQYKDVVSVGNTSITRRIINVADPEVDSDAATKHYVDEKVASGSYVLSAATSTSLGGVRPYGNGLVLDSDGGLHAAPATADAVGVVKPSTSITAASDGTIKINPSIFSDGLTATDAQVSADLGFIGEHLAGDALYYDSTNGLMLKCGTGLHIGNDAVSVDADTLPLATASTRGTVKVGSGLSIAEDGTLSAASAGCDVSYSGFHTSDSTFTSISFNYAFYNRSGDTIPLECKGTVINKTAFTTGTKMQFGVNYSAAKFDNNPVGVFETIMATKKWFGVLVSTSSSTAPKHTVIDSDNIVVTYATSSGFSRAEFEVTVPFDVAANSTIYFYMM